MKPLSEMTTEQLKQVVEFAEHAELVAGQRHKRTRDATKLKKDAQREIERRT